MNGMNATSGSDVHASMRKRLRKALDDSPETLNAISKHAGYDPSYVGGLANGKKTNPTIGALWAIAGALNVKPGWLLGLEDE